MSLMLPLLPGISSLQISNLLVHSPALFPNSLVFPLPVAKTGSCVDPHNKIGHPARRYRHLTHPSWCTTEGRSLLTRAATDPVWHGCLLSSHGESRAKYNLTEPIPLQVEHVAVELIVEPFRQSGPFLCTMIISKPKQSDAEDHTEKIEATSEEDHRRVERTPNNS